MRLLGILAFVVPLVFSFSTFVYAAQINLVDRQWKLLAVPANINEQTIESLFGDDLPIDSYGVEWIIYQFDHATQNYVAPDISDYLKQDEVFWIIQLTGAAVSIDVPNISLPGGLVQSQACASSTGCLQANLINPKRANGWSVLSSPFDRAVSIRDIRLQSSEQACANGCSLIDAATEGLTNGSPLVYDSVTSAYRPVTELAELQPWQALFISSRSASALGTNTLLLPSPTTTTNPEPEPSPKPGTTPITETVPIRRSINPYFVNLECNSCAVGEIKLNWNTDTSEIETLELYSLAGDDRMRLATFGPSDHSTVLTITDTIDFERSSGACFDIISTYVDGTQVTSPESCFELL